jgi:hypothetical protein
MTILIDAEKTFDKIQHLFFVKPLMKLSVEEMYRNIIKTIYGIKTSEKKTFVTLGTNQWL